MLNSYEAIYDHGHIHWIDQLPLLDKARLIVTVLPAAAAPEETALPRRPSPRLRGTRVLVDLKELEAPVIPESDWEALKWGAIESCGRTVELTPPARLIYAHNFSTA